jgi:2-(1,2-epoxy-1,2-dihydrophenyl)acetyl-CoA isomerase
MAEDLLESVKDGVAVLTLNRPDRLNAMSGSMLDALLEALPRLAEDPAVGVVVLTGAGRGFCAGGDVKAMAEGREFGGTTLEEKAQALRSRMEVSRWLHEMPKITIAMVRGAAAGAGLSLALACDLRVASDTARVRDCVRARRLLGRLRRKLVPDAARGQRQGAGALLHGRHR